MVSNAEIKQKAKEIMMRTKPTAIIVGMVYFLARWIMNYSNTQITGLRIIVDYDAYMAGDLASALSYKWPEITFVGGAIAFALVLAGILLRFGFNFYCMDISRGKEAGIANLLDGFSVWGKALCVSLLSSFIVLLMAVFLIVPGVIAFYSYSMVPMLLYDHPDWGVVQCLRMSREMMRGHKMELFRLHLSFIGWLLLSLIPVATVYVAPYMTCSQAIFYNRLSGYTDDKENAASDNTLDNGE